MLLLGLNNIKTNPSKYAAKLNLNNADETMRNYYAHTLLLNQCQTQAHLQDTPQQTVSGALDRCEKTLSRLFFKGRNDFKLNNIRFSADSS
jgi:hypothetical protein